jgi:hypothetical protein
MALDFTTAALDPRVTFTRSGNTATVTNSSGVIAAINADLPRFDYDPTTLVCKGLLIEESRNNLALQSSAFGTLAAWNNQQVNIVENTIQSPDSTVNADTITQNSATSVHGLTGAIVVTSGTAYTWSLFAKANTSTVLQLTYGNAGGTFSGVGYANFNLSTGVVSATGGTLVGSGIQNYGNGWYRCWITATATATGATNTWIAIANSTTYTRLAAFAGDNVSGFYIWGAQCEAGAFLTSYIPTEASQVTRNADVATMTGTNFSDWFNATEGTFVTSHMIPTSTAQANGVYAAQLAATPSTNYIGLRITPSLVARNSVVNTSVVNLDTMTTSYGNVVTNSLAYKANNSAAAANANNPVTSLSVSVPNVDYLSIGSISGISSYLNGYVHGLYYYPQRLTNAEIQAFSK